MSELRPINRREAIKWVLAASATLPLVDPRAFAAQPVAVGYGYDPKVMDSFKPGDLWPLTFRPEQRKAAAALCDLIIPADSKSPSASQLNVQDFIDEWISAPYPNQEHDRAVIIEGLAWLDTESEKRFKQPFVALSDEQKRKIADNICYEPKAAEHFKKAAAFFTRFRDLTTSGFYTTPEGMKDIQYVGNIPQTSFEGPPPEVLKYLKLA